MLTFSICFLFIYTTTTHATHEFVFVWYLWKVKTSRDDITSLEIESWFLMNLKPIGYSLMLRRMLSSMLIFLSKNYGDLSWKPWNVKSRIYYCTKRELHTFPVKKTSFPLYTKYDNVGRYVYLLILRTKTSVSCANINSFATRLPAALTEIENYLYICLPLDPQIA